MFKLWVPERSQIVFAQSRQYFGTIVSMSVQEHYLDDAVSREGVVNLRVNIDSAQYIYVILRFGVIR